MASRKKATQTNKSAPKRGRPSAKPATIDLEAKEVKEDAKSSPAEKTAAKPGAKKAEPAKDAKKDAEVKTKPSASADEKSTAKSSTKPEKQTPPPQAKTKSSFGSMLTLSLLSAILGAGASVIGLGLLGHSKQARSIPFVEKFYSGFSSSDEENTQESAGLKAQVEELSKANTHINLKLTDLEKSSSQPAQNTETTAQLSELTSKVEEIDKIINAADSGEEDSNATATAMANGIKLAAISQKQTELEEQIFKLGAKAAPDLSAIENTLTDLMAKTNTIEQSAQSNASGIAELSSGAEAIASQIEAVKVNEQVAGSVAINALKTALQNNDSILIALSSIEALSGETEQTKRLKEIADKGIPNLKTLTAELDAIVQTIQNPVEVADDASFTDKLWASAGSLVTVRSTAPREGKDPLAIFSRIKANLENDNLEGVETEWSSLPADLREKHAGWIEKVTLRKEAFALHQQLSDGLAVNAG